MMRHLLDHGDNLDGQRDKQGNTRMDRAVTYGISSDQKESPVDWPPHEDVTRQATKAGSLLSTVCWSQKERAPSSPVQEYHQEKLEAERRKDRLMDITLLPERSMESKSSDGSSLCRIATDSMMTMGNNSHLNQLAAMALCDLSIAFYIISHSILFKKIEALT